MNDNDMSGPGAHEDSAISALGAERIDEAKVLAVLALAAAVNRLAAAQEVIASFNTD